MKRLIRPAALFLICALLITATGCRREEPAAEPLTRLTATTYPLYVLTSAVTAGAQGVQVRRLNTGSVSCLHDYTLTVADMRLLEQTDILVMNGAGLEEFLHDALEQTGAQQLDCAGAVHLLEADSHTAHAEHGHDHAHDPHYWMDPQAVAQAAGAIASSLAEADPGQASLYLGNAAQVSALLESAYRCWAEQLSALTSPYLITFHDGFYYFADAFDLEILFSMEEEDGATASGKDILTAASLVKEYGLPAIFAEVNGSASAAGAVAGETGTAVRRLSMLMDGEDAGTGADAGTILTALYLEPMEENIRTLLEVLR